MSTVVRKSILFSAIPRSAILLGAALALTSPRAVAVENEDPYLATWSLVWQGAQDRYTGKLEVTGNPSPTTYYGKLTLIKSNGHIVTQEANITVTGNEVRIECLNPSDTTWYPDRFYVVRTDKRMEGYSLDTAGQRGSKIVFTRL